MGHGHANRWLVAALVVAVVLAALAVELLGSDRVRSQRDDRVEAAQLGVRDAVAERVLLIDGVADMIGVRDDVALGEMTRFARARTRSDPALLSLQWLRRAPGGTLLPSPGVGAAPVLAPAPAADHALAHADRSSEARAAIAAAERHNSTAVSEPVTLAGGGTAVYVAVPVDPGSYGGRLASAESESVVVGLVAMRPLAADAAGSGPAMTVTDAVGPLASVGGEQRIPISATIDVYGRDWTIGVEGAVRSPLERALPWLILLVGLIFTGVVAVLLGRAIRRRDEALRDARQRADELEQRSREDALTGVSNRRHFSERLARELSRGGEGVAVLLIDLDEFKRVNDRHGHLAGDLALQVSAHRLAGALRGTELLARWGGEEFAVLVPRIGRADAVALGERLRSALADRQIDLGGEGVRLTGSVGVALAADGLSTPDELVGAADRALYAAKDAGRNAVRTWAPAPATNEDAATGSRLP